MKDNQKTKTLPTNGLSELNQHGSKPDDVNQIEEQLQIFMCAVEQNPVSIVITDINGIITYVNPMFTEVTGYTFKDVVGKNPKILKSGHTTSEEYASLWQTIKSGKTWHGKFYNRKENGDLYWETISISPVVSKMGVTTHYVAIKEDLTYRKLVEDTIEKERRLLRAVVDNIPDQIFVHDRDCRFVLNNLSDARVLGVNDPALLQGKSDVDFYPPELAANYQANDRQVMETNQPLIIEEEPSVTASGQKRWVNVIKVPFQDNKGKVIGLVGI
ncbi:MAG: PAS domain S-box protein, partial [Anaerolineaceae bacterium]|nr:PAS domain S-box protein [Anaerolineaceae bacterium]